MTPESSPEPHEQLHYWAVTFDGQAPGADEIREIDGYTFPDKL